MRREAAMIIPYGHERSTVRRLPWVTFTLIALCVLTFIGINVASGDHGQGQASVLLKQVLQYLSTHPYLETGSRFEQTLRERLTEQDYEQFQAYLAAIKHFGGQAPDSRARVREEQEELDRRVDSLLAALAKVWQGPFYRYGLVPADLKLHSVITYQFLHGGFWHLFFNMLFLFLAAPFIEDVWGRPVFAAFFLLAGVVSGLMYAIHYPDFQGPLIGASGAVAGVMGAFLVRCWNTRIRFLYIFGPVRPLYGTFSSPAWVMLPLWFLGELFNAQAGDVASSASGGGGVAHWAHVWGFGFGLAVAGAMIYLKVEERYIHPAIESKITLVDNTAVERAMQARSEGRMDEAVGLLRRELSSHPDNIDAALAWWSMAVVTGTTREAVPHFLAAVRRVLRTNDPSPVLNHWHELLQAAPDLELDPQLGLRVAEILHDHGHEDSVSATLAAVVRGLRPDAASGLLLRLARLAAAARDPSQARLAASALAAPDLPVHARGELEALAADHGPAPAEPAPEREPEMVAAPEAGDRTLQVMEVIPVSLDDETLVFEVRGGTRRVGLSQVHAIGVGGVRRGDQRPALVVDLLLDPPWSERRTLRALRLLSTSFDPRRLVGGQDAMAAFRELLGLLQSRSGAVPLPDPDAVRGEPFRMYASLEAYQKDALGVEGDGLGA